MIVSGLGVILPLIGVTLGFFVAPKLPVLSWKMIAVAGLVLLPLSLYSPVAIRTSRLKLKASMEIPIFPNSEKVQPDPRHHVESPGTKLVLLRSSASSKEVRQFYENELRRRGWSSYGEGWTYYPRFAADGGDWLGEFKKGSDATGLDTMVIDIWDRAASREIEVRYQPYKPPSH